jgi:hypothetical protein
MPKRHASFIADNNVIALPGVCNRSSLGLDGLAITVERLDPAFYGAADHIGQPMELHGFSARVVEEHDAFTTVFIPQSGVAIGFWHVGEHQRDLINQILSTVTVAAHPAPIPQRSSPPPSAQ